MNLLLISPSSGHWKGIGKKKVFNGKTFRFSMLSLLTVAALTPKNCKIKIIDEQIEDIPVDTDFDLVGITVMTATAPRAYEICEYYKQRSIPVVLGGFHPTFNQAEALSHASAIVIGPAYGAWEQLITDFQAGKLQKIYYGNPKGNIPRTLPRHLMNGSGYITANATFATLGCQNSCHFCSITSFYKGQRYQRDVQDVVNEVAGFKQKFFMFVDDNLTQDREYIMKLLKALIPLKKKWVTQASIEIADDPPLLHLLSEAGCAGLFIGLESFSSKALAQQEKNIKLPEKYKEAIQIIHNHGIFVESGLVFGFDTDTRDIFHNTLEIVERIGVDAIQVSILTPLPGTVLFREMKDRIIDHDWKHYDYKYPVFEPKNMSGEELRAGTQWLRRKYYSPYRILKRLLRWITTPGGLKNLVFPLFLNIAYWGRLGHFNVKGWDPAKKHNTKLNMLFADT